MAKRVFFSRPRWSLRYWIGWIFIRFFGWRIEGKLPDEKKFVMIAVPHTSNWDTPFMLGISYILGLRLSFMVKHTMFWGPFGPFFRWLGGIAVDRRAPRGLVGECVRAFGEAEELVLVIPPEGTRSRVKSWKSGFYHIALQAGVPIVLGYLDFGRKVGGVGPALIPTGNIEADLEIIRKFYAGMKGKHPEFMSEIRLRTLEEEDEARPRRASAGR